MGTFLPHRQEVHGEEADIIARALDQPIQSAPLGQLVRPGMQIVIVTSDNTRPCPNKTLLPPLLERLTAAGIDYTDITIVIALGLHRPMTEKELRESVGDEVFSRVQVINHDISDVLEVGKTRRGTPVRIFRPVVEADFRICVSNVEFHYFAGYSGGAKAIVPGVAAPITVRANHGHMIESSAVAASLAGNPVREDLEEAAAMVGIDYILNVVVDEGHRVIDACSGGVKAAHRIFVIGVRRHSIHTHPLNILSSVPVGSGTPMYQAQKALDNCAGVVRKGGVIILVAECKEGYGNDTFQRWMTSGKEPKDLLEDIRKEFVLGGHKAAAISKVAVQTKIILVTSNKLAEEQLVGMEVYRDLDAAIEAGFALVGKGADYAVFPYGASVLPKIIA